MDLLEVEQLALSQRRARRGWVRSWTEEVPLVEELTFSIPKGKSLALVWDSRPGQMALALALVRMGRIAAGTIRIDGAPVSAMGPRRFHPFRQRIQAVFPDGSGQLPPRLTVRETFRETLSVWHRRASREERRRLVESAMIACRLPEAIQDLYPVELDAVERQQVALVRALLPGPEILVVCGLVDGLDSVQRAELVNGLRHLREEFNLSLLVLTDDLAVAHLLGDDVGVLHRGRLVEMGPAEEVASHPTHDHTRRLVACAA